MNRTIYELLNDTKTDLEIYETGEPLTPAEKRRITNTITNKNKNSYFYNRKRGLTAAVLGILILSTSFLWKDPVYGFVQSLGYNINLFLQTGQIDDYVNVINSTIEENGISVTLNEVVLDGDELIVTRTVVFDEPALEIKSLGLSDNIKINGKYTISGASGSSRQVDEATYKMIDIYGLTKELDENNENVIEFLVDKVYFYNGEIEKEVAYTGKWNFHFKAMGNELMADTITVEMNDTIDLPDGQSLQFIKFTSNPIGQKIYFAIPEDGLDYIINLNGWDDLGNEVAFYLSHADKTTGVLKVETIDNGPIDQNAGEFTLFPSIAEKSQESGRMNLDFTPLEQPIFVKLP